MFEEIKAALQQWKNDITYARKTAPSDWSMKAQAHAEETIQKLLPLIDDYVTGEAARLLKLREDAELNNKSLMDELIFCNSEISRLSSQNQIGESHIEKKIDTDTNLVAK